MINFSDAFINQVVAGSAWTYPIILFATLFEAIPVLGFFIPGQTILILAGFSAKINHLSLAGIIFLAALSALVGDFSGYFLGKKFGYELLKKFGLFFRISHKNLDKTEQMIKNNTGKTLILGRLNSFSRALAPFVAGASGVSLKDFIKYSGVGALLWAGIFGPLGYFFGHNYKTIALYGDVLLIIFAVVIIIAILSKIIFFRNRD